MGLLDTSSPFDVELFLDGKFKVYPLRDFIHFKDVKKTLIRGELKYSVPEKLIRGSIDNLKSDLLGLEYLLSLEDYSRNNLSVSIEDSNGFIDFKVRFN